MKRRERMSGKRARAETTKRWKEEGKSEKEQSQNRSKSKKEQDCGKQWKKQITTII